MEAGGCRELAVSFVPNSTVDTQALMLRSRRLRLEARGRCEACFPGARGAEKSIHRMAAAAQP